MIWPFRAKLEMIEALEWNTDVIVSRSGAEQRIALKPAPVRNYSLNHVFTGPEYAAAREIMREAEAFEIPDWPLSRSASAVSASSSSVLIPCLLAEEMGLSADDDILLWTSTSEYQSAVVESVDGSGITVDSLGSDFSGGRVAPLVSCLCNEGLSATRQIGRFTQASIEFLATENADLSNTDYPQYLGHDVMTDVPLLGAIREGMAWSIEDIDNKIGTPVYLRTSDVPVNKFTLSWRKTTAAGILSLREWLHSRYGKQKAFWASSWSNDFALAEAIGASDETITVSVPSGLVDWYRDAFDIEILSTAGTSYYRRITTAEIVDSMLELTFSGALGVALAIDDVKRISLLRCARFDADRIEMLFRPGEGCAVSVPCVEIPEP